MEVGWVILLQLTLSKTIPLLLAAMGGLLSERSGVINIVLEGTMLAGAFGSVAGASLTGSPWLGLLFGILAGCLLGLFHAISAIRYRADQIVSGTAVNLLAVGGTGFLLHILFGSHGSSANAPKLPSLTMGSIVAYPTTLLAVLALIVLSIMLTRTSWGLRLRAAGERPGALLGAGIDVRQIRYIAVVAGAGLAGAAGAHLALADLSQFVERMTAGRGFIALAALIFGKWQPRGILLACLFFGGAEALADGFQGFGSQIPSQVLLAMPFVLTLIVLAGFVGSSRAPSALGRPLES